MINRRPTRPWVAAITAVLLTALTVAVPLLDRGAGPRTVSIAGAAVPTGAVDHDHRICLQHASAAWALVVAVEAPAAHRHRPEPGPAGSPLLPDSRLASSHQPRAPPFL